MRKLITIDCQYIHPSFAAAYLLIDETEGTRRAAFVETNTTHAVPRLLAALAEQGMRPEQVDYVIVTHIHLDHAGGASALMEACPHAKLLAHPRATRHAIDPSRLVESARKVYGDQAYNELYGEIGPIPAERVRAMEDGEEIFLGSAPLRFLHTRGHANHHFSVFDPQLNGVFTGDSFGLVYPQLQKGGRFIIPSTSPTDFDLKDAQASIDRIIATGADRAYLTHFGEIRDLPAAAEQLKEHLAMSARLMEEAKASTLGQAERKLICEEKMRQYYDDYLQRRGVALSAREWEILKLDLDLNAQGVVYSAMKQT